MNYEITDRWKGSMEYFLLEHPPDRLILCSHSDCEDIADYLEVNEQGRESFACAGHTSSERHALVLGKGVSSSEPRRSRSVAEAVRYNTPDGGAPLEPLFLKHFLTMSAAGVNEGRLFALRSSGQARNPIKGRKEWPS